MVVQLVPYVVSFKYGLLKEEDDNKKVVNRMIELRSG